METKTYSNRREHDAVRAKRVRRERGSVRLAWLAIGQPKLKLPVLVTFRRFASHPLDVDNLPSAFKAVIDELAAISGVNDRDPRYSFRFTQEKQSMSEPQAIEIEWQPLRRSRKIAIEVWR